MAAALIAVALFGVGGYLFGSVSRLFFRRRRAGFGRVALAFFVRTAIIVPAFWVYVVLVLADEGDEVAIGLIVMLGVPVAFIGAALNAYRHSTNTKVLSQKPGASYILDRNVPPAQQPNSVRSVAPPAPRVTRVDDPRLPGRSRISG